jgi:hypothetical protein
MKLALEIVATGAGMFLATATCIVPGSAPIANLITNRRADTILPHFVLEHLAQPAWRLYLTGGATCL